MNNCFSLFLSHIKQNPEDLAIVDADNTMWDYSTLLFHSENIARHLVQKGSKSGDIIGIAAKRGRWFIASVFACFRIGAAYTPILNSDGSSHIEGLSLRCFLNFNENCKPINDELYVDSLAILDNALPDLTDELFSGEHIAYVLSTSGSTGIPKGVPVLHRGLLNLLESQHELFKLTKPTRFLQLAKVSFDASVWEIFYPLAYGHTLYIAQSNHDGHYLAQYLEQKCIEVMSIVPSLLNQIPYSYYPHLHTIVVGGEATPLPLREKWRIGRRFINSYGPTECTVALTNGEDKRLPYFSLGKSVLNTQLYLIDENNHIIEGEGIGELVATGVGVVDCYYGANNSHLCHIEGIEEKVYRTGDRVKRLTSGELVFIGRMDFRVKLAGEFIDIEYIEIILSGAKHVKGIIVEQDETTIPASLAAFIEVDTNSDFNLVDFRLFAQQQLPKKWLPKKYYTISAFPLTANGKINRNAIRQKEIKPKAVLNEKPSVELFTQLCCDVLLENIQPDDDLFAFGIDSLDMITLISEAASRLEITIKLSDFWQQKTPFAIFEQANHISNSADITHSCKVISVMEKDLVVASLFDPTSWNEGITFHWEKPISMKQTQQIIQSLLISEPNLTNYFKVQRESITKHTNTVNVQTIMKWFDKSSFAINAATEQLNVPINIQTGCLFRLFASPSSLSLVCHHALLDGLALTHIVIPTITLLYREALRGYLPLDITPFARKETQLLDLSVPTNRPDALLIQYFHTIYQGLFDIARLRKNIVGTTRIPIPFFSLLRQKNGTDFTLLLSCWQKALSTVMCQSHVSVGTAMRPYGLSKTSTLCGYYLNMFLIPSPCLNQTLEHVLTENNQFFEIGFALSCIPYSELQKRIRDHNIQQKKQFDVLATINVEPALSNTKDVTVSHIFHADKKAKYPFSLHLEQKNNQFIGWIDSDNSCISPQQTQQVANIFLSLLSGYIHG